MFDQDQLIKEATYKAVLSSGPGGQHANKASTKVVLEWKSDESAIFSEEEVERLQKKLSSYLTNANIIQLSCEETRSQHKNKAIVTARFLELIVQALKKPKKRKKTKPGKAFHEKRLKEKKKKAEKKTSRKDPLK